MWSDPEVASLENVRISTNQDMARRMRLGGLFYVLCCSAIVLMSPVLLAQPYIAIFLGLFIILAVLRLFIYKRGLNLYGRNEKQIEYAISVIYVTTALAWVIFLSWILLSISMLDSSATL